MKCVLAVKSMSVKVICSKSEIEWATINIISACVECEMRVKEDLWSEVAGVVWIVPEEDIMVIGVDFNGQIGKGNR